MRRIAANSIPEGDTRRPYGGEVESREPFVRSAAVDVFDSGLTDRFLELCTSGDIYPRFSYGRRDVKTPQAASQRHVGLIRCSFDRNLWTLMPTRPVTSACPADRAHTDFEHRFDLTKTEYLETGVTYRKLVYHRNANLISFFLFFLSFSPNYLKLENKN